LGPEEGHELPPADLELLRQDRQWPRGGLQELQRHRPLQRKELGGNQQTRGARPPRPLPPGVNVRKLYFLRL
jgi:hypothetical protein